jgi:molybdenum cofactor cytidylyltransferase
MSISCVILAAGNSARMGESKPFLKFNSSLNFLESIVSEYESAGIHEIIVVVNDEVLSLLENSNSILLQNCKFILNPHPEWGRFYSIKIGLQAVGERSHVYLQNIDNPFVNKNLIQLLMAETLNADYSVPFFEGISGHPILISGKVINSILQTNEKGSNLRNILAFFKRSEVKIDDPGILANINTPEDYNRYFQL